MSGQAAKIYEGKRTIDGLVVTVDGARLDEHYAVHRFTKYGFEWTYEGESPQQLAMAILYVMAVVGLTFFFSALLKKSMLATMVSFFSLFLVLPIVTVVLQIASIEPWFLLNYAGDLIINVYGAAPLEISGFFTITVPDYATGVAVLTSYSVITLIAGLLLAVRREL